jgi:hypothetical protein
VDGRKAGFDSLPTFKIQPQNNSAKWVRGIEGTGKVTNIEVHPLYTAIAINDSRVLRSTELAKLGKLCEANGLEYAIMQSAHGMIIIIDKA